MPKRPLRLITPVRLGAPLRKRVRFAYQPKLYKVPAAGAVAAWARSQKYMRYLQSSGRSSADIVGTNTSKRTTVINEDLQARQTRTLYATECIAINRNGASTDIDRRDREVVNVRGFKLQFRVANSNTDVPLCYNWALVSRKDDGTPTTNDFFRGSNSLRNKDANSSLTAIEWARSHINTDEYIILKHKRRRIAPQSPISTVFNSGVQKSYFEVNQYIKMKRQYRFSSAGAAVPISGQIWLITWADTWDSNSMQTPIPNQWSQSTRIVLYFREVKP